MKVREALRTRFHRLLALGLSLGLLVLYLLSRVFLPAFDAPWPVLTVLHGIPTLLVLAAFLLAASLYRFEQGAILKIGLVSYLVVGILAYIAVGEIPPVGNIWGLAFWPTIIVLFHLCPFLPVGCGG